MSGPLERWLVAATCAAAIVLAWSVIEPALAQDVPASQRLRGTSGSSAPPANDFAAPQSASAGSALDRPDPLGPTNYGKPRKKKKNPRGLKNLRPLAAAQPYATAPGARARAAIPEADRPLPGPVYAAIPAPVQPRRPVVEQNPYAPLGFDLGSLRLTPYVEGSVGFDTSPNRSNTSGQSSGFARAEAGVGAETNWSQHQIRGSLRAGYQDYFKDHDANRPDAAATLSGRIDVNRDTTIDLDARFGLDTQKPGSTVTLQTPAGVSTSSRPLIETFGAGAGITERFGRLALSLRGTIDRTAYENATLSDGTKLKLSDDNYNTFGLKSRASYEVTPGISPFVEGFVDARAHDQRIDSTAQAYARNSKGIGARAGSSFEITRTLTGEASVGYANRSYEDRRLQDLRGIITDASLAWSATPLTTVTFKAGTELAETNQAGSSGAVTRRLGLEVSHSLLRNLTLSGGLTYQNTAYSGISQKDDTYSASLRADYNLTRSIMLRGSFTHERLKSSAPGNDYTANVFLLGMRLQH